MGRNYNENQIVELLVKAGGRCIICNKDVMKDWRTHKSVATFERAHIKAYSDKGTRADKNLSVSERNSSDNLLILCSECHTTIDKKVNENIYTVEWLKNRRDKKERQIKKILDVLNDQNCNIVKYLSTIGLQNFNITDNDIYLTCFEKGFFTYNDIINISDDVVVENINQSKEEIDKKFDRRIQRAIDNGKEETVCLFALAPIPLLIYLGFKFNDKHKLKIFTAHRNLNWVYDNSSKSNLIFFVNKPNVGNIENQVALLLNITAKLSSEHIYKAIGTNVDIWEINASNIGVDKINSEDDINKFYETCVETIDIIGTCYGKDKEINLFSALCNSLAITFGRAISAKCHNKINIYDAVKQNDKIIYSYRLSI